VQVETSVGRSTAEFTVQVPASEIAERLTLALPGQRRFTLTEATGSGARVSARANWAAWGARITLRFVPLDDSTTSVRASWTPAVPTTAFTWGQGARDLRALAALIRPEG
jgi:hypothetical protein